MNLEAGYSTPISGAIFICCSQSALAVGYFCRHL